jgi:hypothetical protein
MSANLAIVMVKRKSSGSRARPNRGTPPPTEKGYSQLSFALPRFYLDVLDRESAFLGQRRSQLLEMLVLRKLGKFHLERSPSAPSHKPPTRKDLDATDRFVWHVRAEIKKQFDELRLRMGGIPSKTWIILALNEWIGLPSGVSDLDPTAK